jgi:hypothetical protein
MMPQPTHARDGVLAARDGHWRSRHRMEDRETVIEKILKEVSQDDAEVRDRYLGEFRHEIDEFVEVMAETFLRWYTLDDAIGPDERLGHVSEFAYSAITLHILSMKLFLSGHLVAAGNLIRQVVESMAMALLCSSASLGVLDKFIRGHFSTQKAIVQVIKHAKKLGLKKDGLKHIQKAQTFYHGYSHPSRFTLASHMSFESDGALYVGCSFDEGKIDQYRKEIAGRVGLTKVFPSFIEAVCHNIGI